MANKGISMNTYSKMMFGLMLTNALLMAMQDNKLTAVEALQIMQMLVQMTGGKFKLTTDDFSVLPDDDGGMDIHLSARLVEKISLTV